MKKPAAHEYNAYFKRYIDLVPEGNLIEQLLRSHECVCKAIEPLSEGQLLFRYAPGKWTIKDIVQHLLDTERVFAYRALRIARKDKISLHSFDENSFAAQVETAHRSIKSMMNEAKLVRQTSIELFKSFSDEALNEIGMASNHPLSVRACGYIIAGHDLHHIQVIQERYIWHASDIVFV